MSKESKVPKGILTRASKILGAGLKIAAREAGKQILKSAQQDSSGDGRFKTNIKHIHDLVATLNELKGGAMKLGQMVSLEFSDILPKEIIEIFSQLHSDASHMPLKEVKKILSKELGPEKLAKIQDLSQVPIAAASIGQVHRAKIQGKDVALKIQYQGISKSIDSDINILKRILMLALKASGKKINIDELANEIKLSLKQEANYLREMESINAFRELCHDPRFVIPEVHAEFSTKRLLVMTYIEGIPLRDWLQSKPLQKEVSDIGEALLELILLEFFEFGLVQTDPNYGNFLIDPEQKRIVLLDFGATAKYSKKFRRGMREILNQIVNQEDEQKILKLSIELGLLDEREGEEAKLIFLKLLNSIAEMFLPQNQPFRFDNLDYLNSMRETAWEFMKKVQVSTPKRQIILLNRKLGGIYHILKDAKVESNLNRHWQKVLKLEIL